MGHAPENTLKSIHKAIELGAPCVEIDVQYVDGRLVVFHDNRLDRTTNGTGYVLEQKFDYLRTLDAGESEKIPTLQEVFEAINLRAGVNIELKGSGTARPVAEFISGVQELGWNDDLILVSSFNHHELKLLRRLHPGLKIGALISGLPVDDAVFAESLGAYSAHPSLDFINVRFVNDAHSRGLRVFVFTVDHPEDIRKMRAIGVDGVFTNYPDRVLKDKDKREIKIGWR
jgi:glycerophosphoryl diester phosphodiesterase